MSRRNFKPDFTAIGDAARLQTSKAFRDKFGIEVSLSPISNRAIKQSELWEHPAPRTGFPWDAIKDSHRQADRLEIAVWSGDRLCGLAICVTKNSVLEICFVEGDPDPSSPTSGMIITMILDCAARYAQRRGREQLRVMPANDELAELYKTRYRFHIDQRDPRPSEGNQPFLRREV